MTVNSFNIYENILTQRYPYTQMGDCYGHILESYSIKPFSENNLICEQKSVCPISLQHYIKSHEANYTTRVSLVQEPSCSAIMSSENFVGYKFYQGGITPINISRSSATISVLKTIVFHIPTCLLNLVESQLNHIVEEV